MKCEQQLSTKPLVSIITPCYNGEDHVSRLLESILAQSCTDAELILVNDGSTDGTEEVVTSYRRDLDNTLRGFTYVKQENQGLGGAINTGLKHVTGKYLVWPDADDYLEPASLGMRSAILERAHDFAVVTSDAYVRAEEDLGTIQRLISDSFPRSHEPWQFDLLLNAQSIFTSGTHMARVDAFDATHPGRRIFPAHRGQNLQMLLPLYYRHKRFYLDVPLYNYVVRAGSMSRDSSSLEDEMHRWVGHYEILRETLASIGMPAGDRTRYEDLLRRIHDKDTLRSLSRHGELRQLSLHLKDMARTGTLRVADFRDIIRTAKVAAEPTFHKKTKD